MSIGHYHRHEDLLSKGRDLKDQKLWIDQLVVLWKPFYGPQVISEIQATYADSVECWTLFGNHIDILTVDYQRNSKAVYE